MVAATEMAPKCCPSPVRLVHSDSTLTSTEPGADDEMEK